MDGFAVVSLFGQVMTLPEEKYFGLKDPRRFFEFVVTVERCPGLNNEPERHPFRIAVFNEQLLRRVQSLKPGQYVSVVAELTNRQYESKGRLYDRLSLQARSVQQV